MRARVKMTPARMEKLLTGKSLTFALRQPQFERITEIEIVLDDTEEARAKFDRIFTKLWNGILDKVNKAASAIIK